MNPDSIIRVGDRVIIRGVQVGYDHIHIGRSGTVKGVRYAYRYDGSWSFPGLNIPIYLVEMDSPRPEQVESHRVEKVTAHDRYDPPTAAVGDTVVVLRGASTEPKESVGLIGTVAEIEPPLKTSGGQTISRVYRVKVLGLTRLIAATKVAPAPKPPATGRIRAVPAPEIRVSAKRLQAAQAAHSILGEDAGLDDLIGLAEYIADGTVPGALEPAGEIQPVTIGTAFVTVEPYINISGFEEKLASAVDRAVADVQRRAFDIRVGERRGTTLDEARRATDEALVIRDLAGDALHIVRDNANDDDIVRVNTIRGEVVFLRSDDIDQVVTFLQNAKQVHEAKAA